MITEEIDLKWRFKNYPYIQVSKDGRIFNIKTGREKKIVCNCRSFGVWMPGKKFIPLSKINSRLEKIPKTLRQLLNN